MQKSVAKKKKKKNKRVASTQVTYTYTSIHVTGKCASQVAQNPPTSAGDAREARSLGGEAPLEEGIATHSSILAWRIPWMGESGGGYSQKGHKESDMTEVT